MASAIKDGVNNVLEKLHMSSGDGAAANVSPPSEGEVSQLREKYKKAGQEQVFKFWDELNNGEKAALYGQLQGMDPEHVNKITTRALNPSGSGGSEAKKEEGGEGAFVG